MAGSFAQVLVIYTLPIRSMRTIPTTVGTTTFACPSLLLVAEQTRLYRLSLFLQKKQIPSILIKIFASGAETTRPTLLRHPAKTINAVSSAKMIKNYFTRFSSTDVIFNNSVFILKLIWPYRKSLYF